MQLYTLDFPNEEVREGFFNFLAPYTHRHRKTSHSNTIEEWKAETVGA